VNENAITHYKSVAAAKRNEKLLQEMGTTGNACVEPARIISGIGWIGARKSGCQGC
jgi:hypothetical protein